MRLRTRASNALAGDIILPGDKSITHRAILMAAMAKGESRISHSLISGVTMTMLSAIRQLGADWAMNGDELVITSPGIQAFVQPGMPLDCGNSATTMRLLAGCLAASGVRAILDGSESLRRRPMERIVNPLRRMGVEIEAEPTGTAPLRIHERRPGESLLGMEYHSAVASAQVKSCILLAGLAAREPVTYHEPVLSRNHTELMFKSLGIQIETVQDSSGCAITLQPGGLDYLQPFHLRVPGDFSAASFLIVAAVITPGSRVRLSGVSLNPTRTGLMEILREMGAELSILDQWEEKGEQVGDIEVCSSRLTGVKVDGRRVVDMIDEFPIFAIAASTASGRTIVSGAEELRLKESDRIRMLCAELLKQGVPIEEKSDGFVIDGGGTLAGGKPANAHRDHRLAMALAVLGLVTREPVTVEDAEILAESYPDFPAVLKTLGARVYENEDALMRGDF